MAPSSPWGVLANSLPWAFTFPVVVKSLGVSACTPFRMVRFGELSCVLALVSPADPALLPVFDLVSSHRCSCAPFCLSWLWACLMALPCVTFCTLEFIMMLPSIPAVVAQEPVR